MATAAQSVEQPSSTAERDVHRLRNGLIWTGGLLVLALAIGLAVPDLREVLHRVAEASPAWLLGAVGLEIASCLGYVVVVRMVLPRAPAKDARRLAWAEMAFGAVVPAGGAGGLAVGAWAMRAWGVSWSRIANRSAVIFLLTSLVNVIVLVLSGVAAIPGLGTHRGGLVYGLLPALLGAGVLAFFLVLPRIRTGRKPRALEELASWVTSTERVAFKPDVRLLGAAGYLLLDIAALWVCLRAAGVQAPVTAVVLGYQIGYLANLVPIPGGVGALEGGLLGALVLYGLPAAPTAAAVVLYHAIALWIPTLGGLYGFARLRGSVAQRSSAMVTRLAPRLRQARVECSQRSVA